MFTKISTYKLYKSFIESEFQLNEGLIKSVDIEKCLEFITRFGTSHDIEIVNIDWIGNHCSKFDLEIGKIDLNKLTQFLTLLNNLGYFITSVIMYKNIAGGLRPFQVNYEQFKERFYNENITNCNKIKFIVEAKWSQSIRPDMDILYHVTNRANLDKIFKNGLVSKTKNSLASHPSRIYLCQQLEWAYKFIKTKTIILKKDYKPVDLVILEIDISKIKNDIELFNDPFYVGKGFYTYDNISPKCITLKNNY